MITERVYVVHSANGDANSRNGVEQSSEVHVEWRLAWREIGGSECIASGSIVRNASIQEHEEDDVDGARG